MGVHVTPSSFGGGHGIRDSGLGIRNSGLGDQGSGIRDLDFSYSTGDTHFIMYATGSSPYGPFTIRGKILEPVLGWTSHHSIVDSYREEGCQGARVPGCQGAKVPKVPRCESRIPGPESRLSTWHVVARSTQHVSGVT